jgi:shikimate kinase
MSAPSESVILIGPMGVGKTTVGKRLASEWNLPFIDTDALIVKAHGPIDQIFATKGESVFRELEALALSTAMKSHAVISTGGGVVLNPKNREQLKGGLVVYLSTNGKHMASRLSGSKRPLLENGMSDWKRIYEERKPLYVEVSNFVIDTSEMSLKSIVAKIEDLFK